jgi:hypothetical protein
MRKRTREATLQQRAYLEARLAGKNRKEATLDAGATLSTAENTKQKIDASPEVRRLFTQLLGIWFALACVKASQWR